MTAAVIDIETRKVDVFPSYAPNERPNQRPVTKRWQPFLVGVALVEEIEVVELIEGINLDPYAQELTVLDSLDRWLRGNFVDRIFYAATRNFDEMVLRGRFINARREHLLVPGPWPSLHRAGSYEWTQLKPLPNPDPEGSKNAPRLWDAGQRDVVRIHCEADVRRVLEIVR